MEDVLLPVEEASALAAALDHAQTTCAALGDKDALRLLLVDVLRTIPERFQPSVEQWAYGIPSRGVRPGLPNRNKYWKKLGDGTALKAARGAAYEAMDALLDLVWPTTHASSTERSRKAHADPLYRDNALAFDVIAKDAVLRDRGVDGVSPVSNICRVQMSVWRVTSRALRSRRLPTGSVLVRGTACAAEMTKVRTLY